ncbi:MAG TPA: ShlB/FhaC/HecB family hemolysin secretion/activation protein [Accumulibacter sp.]|nr:ShlB/FhaC/HecB family hemolysin secretion/activation protein [Accumulibacter sp.]
MTFPFPRHRVADGRACADVAHGRPRKPSPPAPPRGYPPLAALLLCSLLVPGANAQSPAGDIAGQELQRQQERTRALREQQERTPDVRLPAVKADPPPKLPETETPCFVIDRIVLQSDFPVFDDAVSAANPPDDPALGRCLGTAGIHRAMQRIQNAIIERGFVTTRVLAATQDLQTGVLTLTIIPGRLRAIRFSDDSGARANAWNALPAKPGDLLNLRDIEQALENFKRVPTADADIQIVPGDQPGESDLVISWRQTRPFRVTLTANDGGSRATGTYQGSATLSGDHLLTLNDLAYLSINRDLGGGQSGSRGTRGNTAHYSLPWGYHLLGATFSANRYHQTVAGASQAYRYSGTSRNSELKLSRVIHRDAANKTTASLRGYLTTSANFIDDTEIAVQRRRMAGWEAALAHRAFLGDATLDLGAAYRHGTGAFAALRATEDAFGDGTARPRLVTTENALTLPFKVGEHDLRYSGLWRAQWNRTPLVPQDRFSIGGRHTVRGFDGESVLMAERGWIVRNELGLTIAGQELYAALDHGEVGGPSARQLVGKRLTGAALGLRGSNRILGYDLFVGQPVRQPDGFKTARTTVGFNLTLSY